MSGELSILQFGEFELDRTQRRLRCANQTVALSSKVFDLLVYMVENPGRPLSKKELMDAVWAGSFVEESNLTQSVCVLRKALSLESSGYTNPIVTLPGRGYQFTRTVTAAPSPAQEAMLHSVRSSSKIVIEERFTIPEARPKQRKLWIAVATLVAIGIAGWLGWRQWEYQQSGTRVDLVLADFENTTGEPILDHTLNEALRIDLDQSPFLNLLSPTRVQATLAQMQHKDAALTFSIAHEVCERSNSQVVLQGKVSQLGQKYLLMLVAVSCVSGDQLAEAKEEANSKDDILHRLDLVSAEIRRKLGESRNSIKHFDKPLFQENTGSMEALQAYSEGVHLGFRGRYAEGVSLLQRSIELDPGFVAAYFNLAAQYMSLGDGVQARKLYQKAYDMRDAPNIPDTLRFNIVAQYNAYVTGNIYESIRNYQAWIDIYPNHTIPLIDLSNAYKDIGQYELGIEPATKALALNPAMPLIYSALAANQLGAGHLADARATCELAIQRDMDSEPLRITLTEIAYLQKDAISIAAQIAWGKAHNGTRVLSVVAMVAVSEGRMREAQEQMTEVNSTYQHQGLDALSAYFTQEMTQPFAEYGMTAEVRKMLAAASHINGELEPIVALAEIGETDQAETLLKQEITDNPTSVLWAEHYTPIARAAILLSQHKPQDAIEVLRSATQLEEIDTDVPYFRGMAYLDAGQPAMAEAEFNKVISRPYIQTFSSQHPLACLGLARAYAKEGKNPEAQAQYQRLFGLWKSADSSLPILVQAKQEASQLR